MSHPFDLAPLTTAQLRALNADVTRLIHVREDEERTAALEAARKAAQAMGYDLDDIHGPKGRSNAAPYVNTKNPAQTWSGRGRRPKWLIEALQNGASLDEFKT